jgi:hypothetical protein
VVVIRDRHTLADAAHALGVTPAELHARIRAGALPDAVATVREVRT